MKSGQGQRLIKLYWHPGDKVLAPFMGGGTAVVAAIETGRHFIGYELSPDYVSLAEHRIALARAPRQMCFGLFLGGEGR